MADKDRILGMMERLVSNYELTMVERYAIRNALAKLYNHNLELQKRLQALPLNGKWLTGRMEY